MLVQVQYQMHVAEMEALRAGMPPVYVNHSNDGGPAVRDIHMENISVTVGGRDLIQEATITHLLLEGTMVSTLWCLVALSR